MDFCPDFITIKPGCFERVCDILTEIFNCGPTDRGYGRERWRIIAKDINWYSPAEHQAKVAIWAIDFEEEKIHEYLRKQGLVA